jgi:hypothetical protein
MQRLTRRFFGCGLLLLATVAILAGALWFWYTHRPQPASTQETLFQGVTYIRDVRSEPRPLVIHVVRVDLAAPGIGFLVTPGDPGTERPLRARKTSRFLAEFGLQVAVNRDFFEPWYSYTPWNYYPHEGDPVEVLGFASSLGVVYSEGRRPRPTLHLSATNEARFSQPVGETFNAISGNRLLMQEGRILVRGRFAASQMEPHPRTALGLDAGARTLIIVVVDGRQPNYSEGVTLPELAQILQTVGADTALNLDGGGSSTLVVQDASGKPRVLNSPIENRIPGRERPVANHLGVYAGQSAAARD